MTNQYAVGDINSQEQGSGARVVGGKPNWALMPLDQWQWLLNEHLDQMIQYYQELSEPELEISNGSLSRTIASFQQEGSVVAAYDMLNESVLYFMQVTGASFNDVMEDVIRVWEHGELKYAQYNWMKGMPWTVPLACILRHFTARLQGELLDQDTGQDHMAHVICNAMMLCHYTKYYPQGNDLPVKWYQGDTDNGNAIY